MTPDFHSGSGAVLMKRTPMIDLTDDETDEPLWKRCRTVANWTPPPFFLENCRAMMTLYHHQGRRIVDDFSTLILPHDARNQTFHLNLWMDNRYSHIPKWRHPVLDLVFAKILEIYATVTPETCPRNIQIGDLVPLPVIFYLAPPEIIRKWIYKFGPCNYICSNFTLMFRRYAFKPTVTTPMKF